MDVVGSKPIVRPIFLSRVMRSGVRKASFFGKKEAKKLCSRVPVPFETPIAQIDRSFLLLFSKKEALPLLPRFSAR
ncbi:hypothetical protein [Acidiphilium acidophilum]|uniref:hypothetical protein n=1 Tax=Acidiphilium acidophilum TaxID=76588 RepID=UPI002E8E71CC|nr:hypothetical protein [Acidiphilium acidophilum]